MSESASSASIYTDPSEATYLLLTPFDMPIDGHAVWAIAFSSNSGTLITAALSVMITVIFLMLWNLACFIALLSSSNPSRRRLAALTLLWNSNDPGFALFKMLHYAMHYFGKGGDAVFGFAWVLVALAVFGGSIALGIVGPSLVELGSAAPVRPSSTYYPGTIAKGGDVQIGVQKIYELTASSYIRALGSIEDVDVTKRKEVNVDTPDMEPEGSGLPMYRVNYNYAITGEGFGLQHGADLQLQVSGSCTTEYSWSFPDASNDVCDWYIPWNNDSVKTPVPIDEQSASYGPKATFIIDPKANQQQTPNISYAVVPWCARRLSATQGSGQDPWYMTEDAPKNVSNLARFRIRRDRPALSCWQRDLWQYGTAIPPGTIANLLIQAKHLGPDVVKVPLPLLQVLESSTAAPKIISLAGAAGDSALRSKTTSLNGIMDAGANSIRKDMERLVLASYVATQNTLVDTTMFHSDDSWVNMLVGQDGRPAQGVGDFVLISPDIQTFSMVGLITIAVVMAALLLIEAGVTWLIRHHHRQAHADASLPTDPTTSSNNSNKKPHKRFGLILFKTLSATDLLRRVYEPDTPAKTGEVLDHDWPCNVHWPTHGDKTQFDLTPCTQTSNILCRGHISRPPRAPPATTTGSIATAPVSPLEKDDGTRAAASPVSTVTDGGLDNYSPPGGNSQPPLVTGLGNGGGIQAVPGPQPGMSLGGGANPAPPSYIHLHDQTRGY